MMAVNHMQANLKNINKCICILYSPKFGFPGSFYLWHLNVSFYVSSFFPSFLFSYYLFYKTSAMKHLCLLISIKLSYLIFLYLWAAARLALYFEEHFFSIFFITCPLNLVFNVVLGLYSKFYILEGCHTCFCEKMPPCLRRAVPGCSRTDLLLAKPKSSVTIITFVIKYLRRKKKRCNSS